MHQNHYFLSHVATQLALELAGFRIEEIFTQTKRELIIRLTSDSGERIIKSHHGASFSCLSFPESFARKRANTASLMSEIVGHKVVDCWAFTNERALALELTDNWALVFLQYGTRSNELLFHSGKLISSFRRLRNTDIHLADLHRDLEPTDLSFPPIQGFAKKLLRDEDLTDFIGRLKSSREYHIVDTGKKLRLSMVAYAEVLESFDNPLTALSRFFICFIRAEQLNVTKNRAEQTIKRQLARTANYISKTEKKLEKLDRGINHQHRGDLLMANLHLIHKGASSVLLEDFYTHEHREIKLNPTLSAQKNAERYYRKAKNQAKEIHTLTSNLESKRKQYESLHAQLAKVQQATDMKQLKALLPDPKLTGVSNTPNPYHLRTFKGFTIWIGKGAKQNDDMLRLTHKEDIWLHVKDGSGSHVIIRRPGSSVPSSLLTYAAELAAFNSKRKHDSLVPVIYTPRKFVRKKKGMSPGAVVVEREQVILVEPVNH